MSDEPDSIASAVEAARPDEPAPVMLTEFYALCKKVGKATKREFVKAAPPGSKSFWFVAQDVIEQTLIGDEKAGAIQLQNDKGEQVIDDARLSRLFDCMQGLAEKSNGRTA